MANLPRWTESQSVSTQVLDDLGDDPPIVDSYEGRFEWRAIYEGNEEDQFEFRIVDDDTGRSRDFFYFRKRQHWGEPWAKVLINCTAAQLCRVKARVDVYSDGSYSAPEYLSPVHRMGESLETNPYPETH